MARVLRGEVRWASLRAGVGSEQTGHRPVLIISHDVFNERSGTVIVLPLTSREPRVGFPLTLESQTPGLQRRSWVKIAQVLTLSTKRLGGLVGRAPPEEVVTVIEGLNEIIGG